MAEVIWYRHEVEGLHVTLLSGRISPDHWLCGLEQNDGQITKDTEQWFDSEVAAVAAAYRLCMRDYPSALAA